MASNNATARVSCWFEDSFEAVKPCHNFLRLETNKLFAACEKPHVGSFTYAQHPRKVLAEQLSPFIEPIGGKMLMQFG
eukprot:CAMPEP_0180506146 /NCGR_PEP_ID=MMETSP1036_2-20121128/47802_1 /TAXON_ID=632150 /ORGANISM="Azadinium spinosum, Strain 3D9" /LENGTH=77 /DNA_ID=CAMNT_0022516005 /DNA_START=317 /DNA_END=550 /DNA_ORIENTATION=+